MFLVRLLQTYSWEILSEAVCGLNVQFPTEDGSHDTRDNSFYGELEQVFD
jgi:hypothetical protein